MDKTEPKCPKCSSPHTYADGALWVCPECAHEWSQTAAAQAVEAADDSPQVIKDAFGNILQDGDSVTLIKELKVKGSSSAIKVGTKVKSIRLVDGHDGHNISCKIDTFGAMVIKSEFVKKA